MARVPIKVSIKGGGDVSAALADAFNRLVKRILKEPDCCKLCRENQDPDAVPMHINCRCKVVLEFEEE